MTGNENQVTSEGSATTDPRAAVITVRTTADAAQSNLDHHARVCYSCRIGQDGMCAEGELLSAAFSSAIVVSVAAHEAYAPTGSTVTYHGTETKHRGPGWTVRSTVQGSWGTSYTIARNIGRARDAAQDVVLNGVRIEYITPAQDDPRFMGRRNRADAIANGTLIEIPQMLRAELGYLPVTFTAAAWADAVAWTDEDTARTGTPQDEEGRLLAVLAMARRVARDARYDRPVTFSVFRYSRDDVDDTNLEALKTCLQLNLDYDDGLVFTISLPGED